MMDLQDRIIQQKSGPKRVRFWFVYTATTDQPLYRVYHWMS
jgi:hypothetical protein